MQRGRRGRGDSDNRFAGKIIMPKTYADIPYGEKPAQKLDIIVGESDKTVVYIHGGGLTGGDKKTDFPLIKELSKKGYSIVSVGYTLYPEAKFPDFINDCALALRFIVDNAEKYGYGDKISIVGGSAGAYITLMLFFDERYLSAVGLTTSDFVGFLSDSAQPTTHFNVLKERGEPTYAIRVDAAAPLYFIKEKNYGAKLFVVTYTDDMFCRKEQNEVLDKTLISYGVEHEFFLLDGGHCSGEWEDENGTVRLVPIVEKLFGNE